MGDVFTDDVVQLVLTNHDEGIEGFDLYGLRPPLRERVQIGCLNWLLNHFRPAT